MFADLITLKLTALCRLVGVVAAVVLCIALPPEWNALVILADKLQVVVMIK